MMYRQGDVLLIATSQDPVGSEPLPDRRRRIVFAHGEVIEVDPVVEAFLPSATCAALDAPIAATIDTMRKTVNAAIGKDTR